MLQILFMEFFIMKNLKQAPSSYFSLVRRIEEKNETLLDFEKRIITIFLDENLEDIKRLKLDVKKEAMATIYISKKLNSYYWQKTEINHQEHYDNQRKSLNLIKSFRDLAKELATEERRISKSKKHLY